jgi:pimeloyl-ACP methyl ester carboxylesterase
VELDSFSLAKRFVHVGDTRVAYHDDGDGPPLLLLHGCPFSSFVWRKVIPHLATTHRCIAPDLLGLGDTETRPGVDWSLPAQEVMVLGLLDALGIDRASVVGHDHGGAVAQLLAAYHPERIDCLVLCNAEAYDNWPSGDERPIVALTQLPVIGSLLLRVAATRPVHRLLLSVGHAVKNTGVLDDELISGYVRANASDAHRRAKTARFLAGQLDPDNNRCTAAAIDRLRQFDRPTLLLWAADDPHFGPKWAERLRADIPGVVELEVLADTGHLLMEERPDQVAARIARFLAAPCPSHHPLGQGQPR